MTTSHFRTCLRRWAVKIASLLVTGFIFGLAYDWAAPRLYRSEITAGFWLGTAHGALMPTALPSLLMGRDVPIFTERNTGRSYKLGYIAGINLCGFIFFGLAFWQPTSRRRLPEPSSHP